MDMKRQVRSELFRVRSLRIDGDWHYQASSTRSCVHPLEPTHGVWVGWFFYRHGSSSWRNPKKEVAILQVPPPFQSHEAVEEATEGRMGRGYIF